jgi:nucleotide-binding universal stress UspA family protein
MKILIALDESSYSQAALQSVLARPWPEGSLFKVLSVVEPFHPEYAGWQTTYTPVAVEAQKSIQSSSVKLVEESERALAAAFGVGNVSGEVTEGYIKDRILDEAKNWQADLVVVGSHGRRGFTKFLLGSVSEAIASHATCSVEIVRLKPLPQESPVASKGSASETASEKENEVTPES